MIHPRSLLSSSEHRLSEFTTSESNIQLRKILYALKNILQHAELATDMMSLDTFTYSASYPNLECESESECKSDVFFTSAIHGVDTHFSKRATNIVFRMCERTLTRCVLVQSKQYTQQLAHYPIQNTCD